MLKFREIGVDRLVGLAVLLAVVAAIVGIWSGVIRGETAGITIGNSDLNIGSAGELKPLSGWKNYGSEFETAGFKSTRDGIVQLKGLVIGCPRNDGERTIVQLPDTVRPDAIRVMSGIAEGPLDRVRLDVTDNGWVVYRGPLCSGLPPDRENVWVSLEEISFSR